MNRSYPEGVWGGSRAKDGDSRQGRGSACYWKFQVLEMALNAYSRNSSSQTCCCWSCLSCHIALCWPGLQTERIQIEHGRVNRTTTPRSPVYVQCWLRVNKKRAFRFQVLLFYVSTFFFFELRGIISEWSWGCSGVVGSAVPLGQVLPVFAKF